MNEYLDPVLLVISWTLRFAIPIIAIILIMYFYDWIKKKMNKVREEPERIIVKMNTEKDNDSEETFKHTSEEIEELDYNVDDTNNLVKKDIDYTSMTLKELHKLPEVRQIKGFSRMKKDDLLDKLV